MATANARPPQSAETLTGKEAMSLIAPLASKAQPIRIRFIGGTFALQNGRIESAGTAPDTDRVALNLRLGSGATPLDQAWGLAYFEWLVPVAPPPEQPEQCQHARVSCEIEIGYEFAAGTAVTEAQQRAFARVNAGYHAYPYAREFLSSSLSRLGLPPVPAKLLSIGTFVRAAGFRDEAPTVQASRTEGPAVAPRKRKHRS